MKGLGPTDAVVLEASTGSFCWADQKALWVHVVTGEFGIPTVYKPAVVVRELRKLFAQYCLLNRQIVTHKNNAQAIFVENGFKLKKEFKYGIVLPVPSPLAQPVPGGRL